MTDGKTIREARESRGWTLEDLSKKSQLAKGYLSEVERGLKIPPKPSLERIERALGLAQDLPDTYTELGELSDREISLVSSYRLCDPKIQELLFDQIFAWSKKEAQRREEIEKLKKMNYKVRSVGPTEPSAITPHQPQESPISPRDPDDDHSG